jgi:hypothetical protein
MISDPSTGAEVQVDPEDVARAFGEVHKILFRAHGILSSREQGKENEGDKMNTWAALVCDTHQHHLVFAPENWRENDLAGLDECLNIAARAYHAVLGGGGAVSGAGPLEASLQGLQGADEVVAASTQGHIDDWAGFTFEVNNWGMLRLHRGTLREFRSFKLPGTSWEVRIRGAQGDVHNEEEHHGGALHKLLPVCLFTTRWCPVHPDASNPTCVVWEKQSRLERNLTQHQQQTLCLERAETYWRWCGEVAESPVSMIFMNDSLANAAWSTYPEDGGERTHTHTGRTYQEDGGKGTGRRMRRAVRKLVGSYETASSGWRQLHAWVQDQVCVSIRMYVHT